MTDRHVLRISSATSSSSLATSTGRVSSSRSSRRRRPRRSRSCLTRSYQTTRYSLFRMSLVITCVLFPSLFVALVLTPRAGYSEAIRARYASTEDRARQHDGGPHPSPVTTNVRLQSCAKGASCSLARATSLVAHAPRQAIECILPEQQGAFVRELEAHVLKCVKDANGNHVSIVCLVVVGPADNGSNRLFKN